MENLAPDVSLFEIDLFVRASRLRSLRELARQLELKPAHVSKVIRRLEVKLGAKLLKRSVSGVLLTREGLELLKTAEEICQLSDQLQPIMAGRKKAGEVEERVWGFGSISFLCTHFLAQGLTSLARDRKGMRFRLVEFTHNELVSHGLNGAFEIAVHIEELQWTKAWLSRNLGPMKWKLYGKKNHPLISVAGDADETQVLKYPFIVPTDWSIQGFSVGEDYCPASWRQRIRGHEASTAETALEIVSETDHLTFVPEIVARKAVATGQLSEIPVRQWAPVAKDIYLSVRSDLVSKQFLQAMTDVLQRRL